MRLVHKISLSAMLLLGVAATATAQKDKHDHDWANFKRYEAANAEIQKAPTAVLMGDSITDIWKRADDQWFEDHNFAGRGISGQVTSQMLVRFRPDVIDLHPKYVVILAGINDIARNMGLISPEHTFGNIVSMCELAKANKIKVVICSLTPANEIGWRKFLGDPTADILKINSWLKDYAKKNKFIYVDYYNALVAEGGGMKPEYANDAVHPSLAGYKVMERVLLETVPKLAK